MGTSDVRNHQPVPTGLIKCLPYCVLEIDASTLDICTSKISLQIKETYSLESYLSKMFIYLNCSFCQIFARAEKDNKIHQKWYIDTRYLKSTFLLTLKKIVRICRSCHCIKKDNLIYKVVKSCQ